MKSSPPPRARTFDLPAINRSKDEGNLEDERSAEFIPRLLADAPSSRTEIRAPFSRRAALRLALFAICAASLIAPLRGANTIGEPATGPKEANLYYLPAGKPDAMALLAPPPLPGSPEQAADMASVRNVSRAASKSDAAMALSEKKFSVYTFAANVGPFFQPDVLPKTTAFFDRIQNDAEMVTDNSKNVFKRPRPYTIDPTLVSGKLEKSFSYPSGHSTESMVLALVLAEVFPEKREVVIGRAREIGWHRVEIARHYPTDIYAGRVLAQAIVREMESNARFQTDLAAVRKEVSPQRQAAKAEDEAVAH